MNKSLKRYAPHIVVFVTPLILYAIAMNDSRAVWTAWVLGGMSVLLIAEWLLIIPGAILGAAIRHPYWLLLPLAVLAAGVSWLFYDRNIADGMPPKLSSAFFVARFFAASIWAYAVHGIVDFVKWRRTKA